MIWCRTPGASKRTCLGLTHYFHEIQHFVNLLFYKRPLSGPFEDLDKPCEFTYFDMKSNIIMYFYAKNCRV